MIARQNKHKHINQLQETAATKKPKAKARANSQRQTAVKIARETARVHGNS